MERADSESASEIGSRPSEMGSRETGGADCERAEEMRETFRVNSFFLSDGVRESVNEGWNDYTPSFLSDVPSLFEDAILPLDVALIQVSPPDELGYCSLGVSVDVIPSAVRAARMWWSMRSCPAPRCETMSSYFPSRSPA